MAESAGPLIGADVIGARLLGFVGAALLMLLFTLPVIGQAEFENRTITDIQIVFAGGDQGNGEAEQYRIIIRDTLGDTYTTVKMRDTIERLYRTGDVVAAVAEAQNVGAGVSLQFTLTRTTRARRVTVEVTGPPGQPVTEQELLLRLSLLDPGAAVSEQELQNNANVVLEYLRDRGFLQAEVAYSQTPVTGDASVDVNFRVNTGAQATIDIFDIQIDGFNTTGMAERLKLRPGTGFTRDRLAEDMQKIREILRDDGYLAPRLDEPRSVYDSDTNTMSIFVVGTSGPTVEVVVEAERDRIGTGTQRRLLPVAREGTLDYAAIVEGERRLENHYQEQGYFFVDVIAVCSVQPELVESGTSIPNETEFLCSALSSHELAGRNVTLTYRVDLNRQLRLVDIRLEGTDQFTIDEIKPALDSQEANIFGIIPLFGYGRGYTSERILEEDAATIRSLLRELGYRDAEVRVNQGVSPDGENLIITFVVEQGPATVVSHVEVTGNTAFTDDELIALLPPLVGENFSRAKLRNAQRIIAEHYSRNGYYDASVDFSIDERAVDPDTGEGIFRVAFNVTNEGGPVYVSRILVTGNERTNDEAILKAAVLRSGRLLTAQDIYASEQNLYASDAFSRVTIRPQPAGDRPDGGRFSDIIIEVEEQQPRLLQLGGGFSTDVGLSGFVDLRHFNLLGNLWQGGGQIRMSQRRQLVQIDFVNPRFIRDGERRYAPLTISAQYQRDSTVTRFFRSAFDRGTFGIVQRLDDDGNPIDEFGEPAGSPTLHRLTLSAETNRTISTRDRSVFFVRYRYEDVRLYNIDSLLVRDLLEPDSRIRISGFGSTFVRDTRRRCGIEYTVLDIIARGSPGEPCRYNASDPTNGDFFTAEYNFSAPILGANIGFHKFQGTYQRYYTVPWLKNTTFAARGILGLASVFSKRERFSSDQFPDLEGILPISERFFAGGSNTLRGFEFESAGPRVVVNPEGEFRNSDGEIVTLDPFTVPFGGNALAIVNLEARIPVSNLIRVVPFYDGGNVFRRVGDIFKPPQVPDDDAFRQNLRALWSHTVGLGLRVRTPIGSEIGVDYGYLLNPPSFVVPQENGPPAFLRLRQGQLHFRFSQSF